jgi:predicted DNA-binding transcriptional regulator YafY
VSVFIGVLHIGLALGVVAWLNRGSGKALSSLGWIIVMAAGLVLWLGGDVVAVDSSTATRVHIDGDALPVLWEAIASLHPVSFTYHGKTRVVEPFGLVSRNGFWYLVGNDSVRSSQIVFRVDRIESQVTIDNKKSFERPVDFDITAAFARDSKDFTTSQERAVVRVDAGVAPAVLRELGDESVVVEHEDGSVDVNVPCGNHVAFRTWLFAMVDRAEVISPPEMRQRVLGWLREIAEVN